MFNLKKISCTLLVVMLLLLPTSALASGGGNGGGNGGGGGGGNNPLTLVSSSPSNLAEDVHPNIEEIVLVFSNNVVGNAETNRELVRLVDSAGNLFPITIIMIEGENREKRHDITIKPNQPLNLAETYKVVVETGLTSNNGQSISEPIEITFTTLASTVELNEEENELSESPANENDEDSVISEETTDQESENSEVAESVSEESNEATEESAAEGNKLPNTATNTFNILTIGILILVSGGVLLYFQRKKIA